MMVPVTVQQEGSVQTPQGTTPTVEQETPASPPKGEGFDFKYSADLKDPEFSIDSLMRKAELRLTIKFNDNLKARYRTFNVDEAQECEKLVMMPDNKEQTAKFVMNEMTIAQLVASIVEINGQAVQDDFPAKEALVRNLPSSLFDLLVSGMNEFDHHVKNLLDKGSVENF